MADMVLDRRAVLAAGTALGGIAALPSLARAAAAAGTSKVDALFADFLDEQIHFSPEMATYLGMDTGKNAALRGMLGVDTAERRDAAKELTASQIARRW